MKYLLITILKKKWQVDTEKTFRIMKLCNFTVEKNPNNISIEFKHYFSQLYFILKCIAKESQETWNFVFVFL